MLCIQHETDHILFWSNIKEAWVESRYTLFAESEAERIELPPFGKWVPYVKSRADEYTEEQVETYMNDSRAMCPRCHGEDIVGEFFEVSGREAWQEIHCQECGERWNDVYELKTIDRITA